MRAVLVAVVLGAVGALGLAACGGGGGEDRLTKEEYVTDADAICKDASDQIDALADPQTKQEIIDYIRAARKIGDEQLTSLRGLSPPEEIEDRVNEAYDLLDQQLALTDDLEQAVQDEDSDKIDEVSNEGQALNDQADAIAQELGMKQCGSS